MNGVSVLVFIAIVVFASWLVKWRAERAAGTGSGRELLEALDHARRGGETPPTPPLAGEAGTAEAGQVRPKTRRERRLARRPRWWRKRRQ